MFSYCAVLLVLCSADITDIERMAVQQRRQIRSGEVVVRSEYGDGRTNHLHIWWDGDSFRNDVLLSQHRDVYVWSDDQYLRWTDQPGRDGGGRIVATVASAKDQGVVGSRVPHDPRRVGMSPTQFLSLTNYPIDEFLTNPARKSTRAEQTKLGDLDCTLVTITNAHGALIRAWICPQYGFGVVKMVVETSHRGEPRYVDSVETDIARYEPSDVWFPRHYRVRLTANGIVEREDEGTIEVISLNKPIPTEVFSLAGMGVPPGWPVSDRTRPDISGPLAWDGKAVVSVERAADTAQAATRLNFVYLFGAGLLAVVSAVLLWRFFSVRAAR